MMQFFVWFNVFYYFFFEFLKAILEEVSPLLNEYIYIA